MRTNSRTLRAAAFAAVSLASLAGLSACEERPYAVPVRQAAAPPVRATVLAGAPTYIAPAPTYVSPPPPPAPTYVEPAVTTTTTVTTTEYASSPAPSYDAPPAYAPPPRTSYRPAPAYDTGAPMIVAMAPIPNPTGPTRHYGYAAAPRPHREYAAVTPAYYAPRVPAPVYAPAPVYHAKPAPKTYAAAPVKPPAPMAKPPMAPAPKTYAAAAPKAPMAPKTMTTVEKKVTATSKTVVADTKVAAATAKVDAAKMGAAAKVATVAAATKLSDAAKKVATAAKPVTPMATASAAPTGDRTTKLAALQASLTDAVSKSGVLTTPARFTANQPADVSLTLPADFAETMRRAADKQGLSDAAASVNMTSVLAGDGFSVTPDDTQSQPLTMGQPTEFHWTVTAQPGAKGPLHADVGADLLGAGSDTLSLGTVQKNAGMQLKMTPRMLGAGILALIVILVLGWLARGRNTPPRGAAARRAGRRARGAGFDRPLDMNAEPEGHH